MSRRRAQYIEVLIRLPVPAGWKPQGTFEHLKARVRADFPLPEQIITKIVKRETVYL